MDGVSPVRLEVNRSRSAYEVVHAGDWPIPRTKYQSLFLEAGASELTVNEPKRVSTRTFAPTPVGDPENRAVFDFRFQKDTYLVGHMALKLFIEVEDGDDIDILVTVKQLDRNGDEVHFFSASGGNANGPVTRGWLRASHRRLNDSRSTTWRPVLAMNAPEPLPAGQIVEVDIPLMPSGTIFGPDETLRLVLQSWSVPGQWEGGVWDMIKTGRCHLHTGPGKISRLLVPVVDAADLRESVIIRNRFMDGEDFRSVKGNKID